MHNTIYRKSFDKGNNDEINNNKHFSKKFRKALFNFYHSNNYYTDDS